MIRSLRVCQLRREPRKKKKKKKCAISRYRTCIAEIFVVGVSGQIVRVFRLRIYILNEMIYEINLILNCGYEIN